MDKGVRFAHYLIDMIVSHIIVFGSVIFLGAIAYIFGDITGSSDGIDRMLNDMENINPILDRIISGVMVCTVCFIIEYVSKGRTIGKFITGSIVVNEDGSKPNMTTYLKRNFCRLIPFEAFSFFGERGWHDSISGTTVVNKKKFEEAVSTSQSLEEIGKNIEEQLN